MLADETNQVKQKPTKRGTHGLVVHVSPQFKEKLKAFTESKGLDISEFARLCMAEYMRANGAELPDGIEVLTPGRRSAKSNLSASAV